jgi:hypothetical protein
MNTLDLARLHVETAIKLSNLGHVKELLVAYEAGTLPAMVVPAVKSTRGRKPGAAPAENRCHWNIGTESQCKNNQKDSNSYCGMHIGKFHLIDTSAEAPALF